MYLLCVPQHLSFSALPYYSASQHARLHDSEHTHTLIHTSAYIYKCVNMDMNIQPNGQIIGCVEHPCGCLLTFVFPTGLALLTIRPTFSFFFLPLSERDTRACALLLFCQSLTHIEIFCTHTHTHTIYPQHTTEYRKTLIILNKLVILTKYKGRCIYRVLRLLIRHRIFFTKKTRALI